MAKRLLFFATKEDLRQLMAAVECVVPIQYVRMGVFAKDAVERHEHIDDIPNLGNAATDSAATGDEFLVVMKDCTAKTYAVQGNDGKIRYFVDQLANENSVTFSPGGFRGSGVLLHGRFATVHDDPVSQALMGQFSKALRRSFRKLKAYWVGREAERLLDAGARLTMSAQAPREFDLKKE